MMAPTTGVFALLLAFASLFHHLLAKAAFAHFMVPMISCSSPRFLSD